MTKKKVLSSICVFFLQNNYSKNVPTLKIKDQNENQIDRRPEYCRTLRLLHFFFSASSLVATSKHTVKIWASPPFWVASSLLPSSSSQHERFLYFFIHLNEVYLLLYFSFLCIFLLFLFFVFQSSFRQKGKRCSKFQLSRVVC